MTHLQFAAFILGSFLITFGICTSVIFKFLMIPICRLYFSAAVSAREPQHRITPERPWYFFRLYVRAGLIGILKRLVACIAVLSVLFTILYKWLGDAASTFGAYGTSLLLSSAFLLGMAFLTSAFALVIQRGVRSAQAHSILTLGATFGMQIGSLFLLGWGFSRTRFLKRGIERWIYVITGTEVTLDSPELQTFICLMPILSFFAFAFVHWRAVKNSEKWFAVSSADE